MSLRDFRPPKKGQRFKEKDVADQLEELRRLGKFTIEGGTISDGPAGKHIVIDRNNGFWAVIGDRASPGTGMYSWKEVKLSLLGTNWYYPEPAQKGYYSSDPAVEANFNKSVPVGTVVWLHVPVTGVPRGDGHVPNFYVFDYSASAPFISGSGESGSGSGESGSGSGISGSASGVSGSAISGSAVSGSATSGSLISGSGSLASGSGISGSEASGSLASGSATSGSVVSGSATSGSLASGSVESGSGISGSLTSGSADSGSGISGSFASGSGISGSGISGSGISGSGASGSGISGSVASGSGASGSGGGGSGGSGACGGSGNLVIEVVTNVSCVDGSIVVTKQQISIPGGVLC